MKNLSKSQKLDLSCSTTNLVVYKNDSIFDWQICVWCVPDKFDYDFLWCTAKICNRFGANYAFSAVSKDAIMDIYWRKILSEKTSWIFPGWDCNRAVLGLVILKWASIFLITLWNEVHLQTRKSMPNFLSHALQKSSSKRCTYIRLPSFGRPWLFLWLGWSWKRFISRIGNKGAYYLTKHFLGVITHVLSS